ncbi:hypothetical protein ACELLULO517_06000 [Acidisoma cellulosilytica]|uniref:Uncharacterized protein n=1 Tax=Acidisoma cellulosilyticum TaxID=2802395 RepID=A0A964E2X8_9PROT|nr:hypothetical protein [Acidisoma cellulosilyticum]MCB8879779.1 hypothetical protein [Acidisoma cellulosilyticum]
MIYDHAAAIAADIAALADCRLFDADWYLSHYPESVADGRDPLIYFCEIGWRQGQKPNPWFDPSFYLEQNGDVAEAGINPLRHYLQDGEAEGRWPSDAFDPGWYRDFHSDIQDAGISPLGHFLAFGAAEGRHPLPSPETAVPAVAEAEPASARDCIEASGLFDVDFYLASYPDVRGDGQDPLTHFLDFGWREGRRPNAYFDPTWYCGQYLNRTTGIEINPLVHYALHGEERAFRPIIYFETEWYRRTYRLSGTTSPLLHYLRHRRSQRFSPISYFDVDFYMRQRGQAVGPNRDPFAHFLRVGLYYDIDPSPAFNTAQYRAAMMPELIPAANPQPGAAFLEKMRREKFNPLIHFLLRQNTPHSVPNIAS